MTLPHRSPSDTLPPVRFLWFGSYAKGEGYPRSETLLAGLRALGHAVEEVHAPLLDGASHRVATAGGGGGARLAWRQARAAATLARRWFRSGAHDVAVVGYGGLLDVGILRLLQNLDRIPVVWDAFVPLYDAVVRDRGLADPGSLRARTLLRIERASGRMADLVLADTEAHASLLREDLGLPAGKTAVVPIAQPDPGPPAPLPEGPGLRVLLVTSHVPLHGVLHVVEAARRIGGRGVRIEVAGSGQGLEAARSAAQGVEGLSLVPEFLPAAEVARRYAASHVGLGIFGETDKAARVVPLKAALTLAHGRALVTRSGPAADAALAGAACLVPAADPAALATALERLRDDRALLVGLAAAGRRRYEEAFTPESAARALLAAVEPLVGSLSGRRDAGGRRGPSSPRAPGS